MPEPAGFQAKLFLIITATYAAGIEISSSYFMVNSLLKKSVYSLLFLFLWVVVLVYAKPFLVPLAFAALFSMLLLPVSKRLENAGAGRAVAILVSVLLLVAFFAGVLLLLFWQISQMAENADQIIQNVTKKIQQLQNYIAGIFKVSPQQQEEMLKKQASSGGGNLAKNIPLLLGGLGGFLAHSILVLIYIFLMMYFRTHFLRFVLKLVPVESRQKAVSTIDKSKNVAQQYLSGLSLMIACLWVMYSIGFSIVGVKNAFFFAILCGFLEIVPFIGNITGTLITVLMSFAQGGDSFLIIGIISTYAVVQFIQTYLLEPLVVGSGVNINPFFTIAGIVAGELLWGIPGMILAIPILGIAKIICDNVEELKPYGFLIGEERKKKTSFIDRIKKWFR